MPSKKQIRGQGKLNLVLYKPKTDGSRPKKRPSTTEQPESRKLQCVTRKAQQQLQRPKLASRKLRSRTPANTTAPANTTTNTSKPHAVAISEQTEKGRASKQQVCH